MPLIPGQQTEQYVSLPEGERHSVVLYMTLINKNQNKTCLSLNIFHERGGSLGVEEEQKVAGCIGES